MRGLLHVILITCLGLPLAAAAAEWHLPTPYSESDHHTRNIRAFADDVRNATGGELDIVVHSGGALFRHADIHRAVRGGQVPAGEMLMGLLGNDDPLFKLDNIPFLATDFDSARTLWEVSRPHVERALADQGLMLLFAVPWPPQGLYVNRPVASVTELKGLKLRAYSPLTARLADLLGARPVNVQATEIAQAFSTGMVDAMITSPSTGVSSQAWDFVDYYIDTRAWIPKNMIIVNRRAFRRLTAKQQDALLKAAARAEARGWAMAEEEAAAKTDTLAANGIEVMQPSEQLARELRAAGRTIADEWARETGERGKAILEALER